jgi:hypothetical protein
MKHLVRLCRNALIALCLCLLMLLLIFFAIAPPRILYLDITDSDGKALENVTISGEQYPLLPGNFLYFAPGASRLVVTAAGYEIAEVKVDHEVNVFRGKVNHATTAGFMHRLHIILARSDTTLQMTWYKGVLTAGGHHSPQVVAIHPQFRGTHLSLDWLQRQYTARTGKDFATLHYLGLVIERDESGQITEVLLDFSRAEGGAVEFLPPEGWPASDRMRRVMYAMDHAPEAGYETTLRIHRRQDSTPYKMGTTFFYCHINGHYCAGTANTYYDPGRKQQKASVRIWLNQQQGDRRLRYAW